MIIIASRRFKQSESLLLCEARAVWQSQLTIKYENALSFVPRNDS